VSATAGALDDALFRGTYPPDHDRPVEPRASHDAYLRTCVERDVGHPANLGDLSAFLRFLRLCAGGVGQCLDLTAFGADAGVDQSTAKRWLSILEASYVVRLLTPWARNLSKRVVKTPRLSFVDAGLVCGLLGVRDAADVATHPLRGALVENLAVMEFVKLFLNHSERPALHVCRDHTGHEVDLLCEAGNSVLPVEVKSAATVPDDALRGLRAFGRLAGRPPGPPGLLVYGGEIPTSGGASPCRRGAR
jgi:predicted AAA+ superfamily ATPase